MLNTFATLRLPVFVTGAGADAQSGSAAMVVFENSVDDAAATICRLRSLHTRVIVQGFVPSQGTGAYLVVNSGHMVQEFMDRCVHDVPITGIYANFDFPEIAGCIGSNGQVGRVHLQANPRRRALPHRQGGAVLRLLIDTGKHNFGSVEFGQS